MTPFLCICGGASSFMFIMHVIFVLYYYFILLNAVIAVLFDDYSSVRQSTEVFSQRISVSI
jgi:hypothetical protein